MTANELSKLSDADFIRECWEDKAEAVLSACSKANFNGSMNEFLTHCTPCGGNWGGMLLSGIKALWPEVYDAIPDHMGVFAFGCICRVLGLCGVSE